MGSSAGRGAWVPENLPPCLGIMQVLFSRQTGGYSTVSYPCQLDRKEGEGSAELPRDCGLCFEVYLQQHSTTGAMGHTHPPQHQTYTQPSSALVLGAPVLPLLPGWRSRPGCLCRVAQ